MLSETCGNCFFSESAFNPQDISAKNISCKRFPPQLILAGSSSAGAQIISLFPQLSRDTRACGEYVDVNEQEDEHGTVDER